MKNLSILVVDDDPVIRRLLQQRLQRENYQVQVAKDGHEASELLGSHYFDVVLTDLMMPGGIGGLEVLEIAKSLYSTIEVVLITAHSSVDTAVQAMKKGATDYLEKPINFDELFLKLDKISNLKTILRSAQDLQQAMDTTENVASQTIQDLEMQTARLQACLDSVETVLLDNSLDEDIRIAKALSLLAEK
ncbi:MAG: response regulator [Desulfobulbaceae bacterium]|nr:MAG: response regulator [Desulfobulbaceae bacterium]